MPQQDAAPADDGGAGTADASADLAHGRLSGVLADSLMPLVQGVMQHREWILSAECLKVAFGVRSMKEQSYCSRVWQAHFNSGAGASNSRFTAVDEGPVSLTQLTEAVRALSLAVAQLFPASVFGARGRRAAEGWQFSYGFDRGWHPDLGHLGDVIITVTLEGACTIQVERIESPRSRAEAWTVTQGVGAYYGIWDDSRWWVMHQVIGSDVRRLSITLRYVNADPPAAASAASATDGLSSRAAARELKRNEWLAEQQRKRQRLVPSLPPSPPSSPDGTVETIASCVAHCVAWPEASACRVPERAPFPQFPSVMERD